MNLTLIINRGKALIMKHKTVLLCGLSLIILLSLAITIGAVASQNDDLPVVEACENEEVTTEVKFLFDKCPETAAVIDETTGMSLKKISRIEGAPSLSETEKEKEVTDTTPQWWTPPVYVTYPSSYDGDSGIVNKAAEYLGYPYVWGGSSPETSFDCSGFVSWSINNSGEGINVGRLNTGSLYGICTPISVDDLEPGDLVFFQNTYGVYGISHVGIYAGGGTMIHCGDSVEYASLYSDFWQQHLLSFGRLPK